MNKRIASIDIYRAITMLMMLWVNDFAGVANLPHWLHHAEAAEDMMGFSDLVFPSFLFCVGLSLPFAIENRFRKGDSIWKVIGHVLLRSLALIVMGLFSMNSGRIEGGFLNGPWFKIIMVIGFFLVWNLYPKTESKGKKTLYTCLQLLGVLILAGLVVYRIAMGKPIRTGWWGILGLLGWAYLICAAAYLACRQKLGRNIIAWVVFIGLMIAISSGCQWLGFYPGGWTHPALVFSGVLVSVMMSKFAKDSKPMNYVGLLLLCALLMFGAGLVSHNFWIISKIQATPTWAFWSLACFLPLLAFIYWIADAKGHTAWANLIKPAGTATLTCYTLPTLWYCFWQTSGAFAEGIPGLVKSMIFAIVIISITGLLSKVNIKLKI